MSGAGTVPSAAPVIAVLGLGEAGSLIARDLITAGAVVRGFDPAVSGFAGVTAADGFISVGSDAEACAGASLVLSVNSAKEAVAALRASLDAVRPGGASLPPSGLTSTPRPRASSGSWPGWARRMASRSPTWP